MSVTFTEPPRAPISTLMDSSVSVPPKVRLEGVATSASVAPRTLIMTFVEAEPVSPAASVAVTWNVYEAPLSPVKLADVNCVRDSHGRRGPLLIRYWTS